MKFFPQLATGAAGQYPLLKRRETRVVVNRTTGGWNVKSVDSGAVKVEWNLNLTGLTDSEWGAIETLFRDVEGRLRPFTFLDPTDNLLARSEDLTAAIWTKDPLLILTAGLADPFGGTGATRIVNAGQTAQRIVQTVGAAGWFQYCVSVYARSTQATEIKPIRSTASSGELVIVNVTPEWQRVWSTGKLTNTDETIGFGLEIPAGGDIVVFGFQAEAQLAPTDYRRTLAGGGVYPNSRFKADGLVVTTQGVDQNTSVVRVESQVEA
jgi:hypothetical protein